MICTPTGSGDSGTGTATTGKPDERDRLGVDADVRAHRQLDAAEDEGLLIDRRCRAWRGRRQNDVDVIEQLEHAVAIPAAKFLSAASPARPDHCAGHEAVAHDRLKVARPCAQAIEMQARALGRGDDEGGGACPFGFRNVDFAGDGERRRDALDGRARLREQALAEIAAGNRDAQAVRAASSCGVTGSAGRSVDTGSSGSCPSMAS